MEANSRRPTRRAILDAGARLGLGTAGLWALRDARWLPATSAASAPPPSDYRALVCVFLDGGNDSFNLFVPRTPSEYAFYAEARQNLAVPSGDLLPVAPPATPGTTFGFHPACPELRTLFTSGRLAVVANVGTLIAPLTPGQYRTGGASVPPQLFSHANQAFQWQANDVTSLENVGWGGLIADRMTAQNGDSPLALCITLNGTNTFEVGRMTVPYAFSSDGTVGLAGLEGPANARRRQAFEALLANAHAHVIAREFARTQQQALTIHGVLRTALAGAVPIQTAFPASDLGQQLASVARLISVRATLGVARQIFYVSMSGFDTHDDQNHRQIGLFVQLSQALAAFQAALDEIGESNRVTTFTGSEFGRTLTSNGDGSDHGWGSHQLVMGGAVLGNRVHGRFPRLEIGGPSDAGDGRIVPTSSVDQYAATLARWFGVGPAAIAEIFPNLAHFPTSDMGFMQT